MLSKRKNITSFISSLAKFCEFPLDCNQRLPIVELKGNREVYVSGYLKIVEYSEEFIAFDGGEFILELYGEEMLMSEFTSGSVSIYGSIKSISIC